MQKYTDIYETQILEKYDHESLFALAGFEVSDYEVCNPLRDDGTPGCFFEYYNGVLYFYDFTYFFGKAGINGVRALKEAYGFESNKEVLQFIKEGIDQVKVSKVRQTPENKVRVEFDKKEWGNNNYFSKYSRNLTPEVLESEGVYLVDSYKASSKKYPSLIPNLIGDPKENLTIAYNKEDRTKLYRPYDPKFKWYGNISKEDVWGIEYISGWEEYCVIVGSVKDYLVMKYEVGEENCIGLQSEYPILPDIVVKKLDNMKKYVIFDNDETGINNSKKLSDLYENLHIILLPLKYDRFGRKTGKDVSDLVEFYGREIITNLY